MKGVKMKTKIADCALCWKSEASKVNCPYRNWPFNEAKLEYLGLNGQCKEKNTMKSNIIYNEDCLVGIKKLPDKSIDLIFADPPFNVGKKYGSSDRRDDYYEWCEKWIDLGFKKLKDTGTFYLMTITRHLEKLYPMLGSRGIFINQVCWKNVAASNSKRNFWNSYQPILIYGKTKDYLFNTYAQTRKIEEQNIRWGGYSTRPQGQLLDYWNDVPFVYAGSIHHKEAIIEPGTNRKVHPCQMPEALAIRAILFSTNENDIILAPFAGSGTTLAMAKRYNRQYIGYETNVDYIKVINKRLSEEENLFNRR